MGFSLFADGFFNMLQQVYVRQIPTMKNFSSLGHRTGWQSFPMSWANWIWKDYDSDKPQYTDVSKTHDNDSSTGL